MEIKEFPVAEYDKIIKGVTGFIFLLIATFLLWGLIALIKGPAISALPGLLGVFILSVTSLICYGYRPKGYLLAPGEIRIKRVFVKEVRIPLDTVKNIYSFSILLFARQTSKLKSLRLAGIGGLFCWAGFFWTKRIGRYWISATHHERLVFIEGKRNYVISPKDPQEFIKAVKGDIS